MKNNHISLGLVAASRTLPLVGWIEKGDRRIAFAMFISKNESPITAGRLAKELAKDHLVSLIIN